MVSLDILCVYPKPFSGRIQIDRSSIVQRGAFGLTFVSNYDHEKVHVKRIAIHRVQLEHKIDLQINLRHENILKLLTVEEDQDFRFIVIECYSATLAQVIEGKYQGPSLPKDIVVLQQLISGLYYIHLNQLVHGEIKPDNIVISATGKIQISSDFGICKLVRPRDTIIMNEYENTALWMAPEILIPYNEPSFDDNVRLEFTPRTDIFSSGCVFYVFSTRREGGVHPYGNRQNHLEVLYNIKAKQPVNIKRSLNDNGLIAHLVEKMIAPDHQDRPSAKDIMKQLEDA